MAGAVLICPLMGEFYIRQSAAGETRGPFDEDQMASLADAGQITLNTEVADESKSSWVAVKDFAELKAALFPEHKKLGLKKQAKEETIQYINKPEDEAKPAITVEEMLAAAEGHTEDTKNLKSTQMKIDKAASLSMPMLAIMMVLSGLANSLPRYQVLMDLFMQGKWEGLIQQPFALVGLFDFLLALGLFLNVFSLFPVVRFRAMLGLGYFLYFYWSLNDPVSMAASVGAGLGLFICTMTLNLPVMITFALVGVGSMGYLAWMAWTAWTATGG
jgi:hypothetical protein